MVTVRRSVLAWDWELRRMTFNGHKATLWSDTNTEHLYWNDGYMSIYLSKLI